MTTIEGKSEAVFYDEKTSTISAYGPARSTIKGTPLTSDDLRDIDAYWRASLYLCLGMLYLKENPLLREPLAVGQTKPRLLGHWGSDAGQSFTYIHFNRLIDKYDLNAIFISGPGHGAPQFCLTRTSRERTPKYIRTRVRTSPGCSASSSSSVFRAVSAAMPPRKPLAASTRAGNSATASRPLTGRRMTIRR